MINLKTLKTQLVQPLCSVQWIVYSRDSELGETFDVADDGAIVEGDRYRLTSIHLYPLSSDGLLLWQSTSESIAALMMAKLGANGATVATALAEAEGEDSGTEEALEPYRVDLMRASAESAIEVRELQSIALEKVLRVPTGSAVLVRSINLGEDLFTTAWNTISAALAPPKAKTEGKGKGKLKGA